jgi:rhodanese-related sulfurtransferase
MEGDELASGDDPSLARPSPSSLAAAGKTARRDDRVVLYSRHETRSVFAASTLAALGYRDVAILQGGFETGNSAA